MATTKKACENGGAQRMFRSVTLGLANDMTLFTDFYMYTIFRWIDCVVGVCFHCNIY